MVTKLKTKLLFYGVAIVWCIPLILYYGVKEFIKFVKLERDMF